MDSYNREEEFSINFCENEEPDIHRYLFYRSFSFDNFHLKRQSIRNRDHSCLNRDHSFLPERSVNNEACARNNSSFQVWE